MKLNLLKPLKRIFTALSGEETEEKNLISVMNKIADTVEEKGGSDSGNNNEGNEEFFLIHITTSDDPEVDTTLDVTGEQLFDAVKAEKILYGRDQNGYQYITISTGFSESDGYNSVTIAMASPANVNEPNVNQRSLGISWDNEDYFSVWYNKDSVRGLPPINKDTDVGKILKINTYGNPQWVQPS